MDLITLELARTAVRAGQTWHNPSLLETSWPLEIVSKGRGSGSPCNNINTAE